MTLTDKLKILNDKIKPAKISALSSKESSKELHKYEYLTGEDLGYKAGIVEQAKFEYSPLGKVFNKEIEKEDKKERLLKRLKNKEQLKAIIDLGKTTGCN